MRRFMLFILLPTLVFGAGKKFKTDSLAITSVLKIAGTERQGFFDHLNASDQVESTGLGDTCVTNAAVKDSVLANTKLIASGVNSGVYYSANLTINDRGIITVAGNGSATSPFWSTNGNDLYPLSLNYTVGIMTASPDNEYALDANGSIRTDSSLFVHDTTVIYQAQNSPALLIYDSNENEQRFKMWLNSNGIAVFDMYDNNQNTIVTIGDANDDIPARINYSTIIGSTDDLSLPVAGTELYVYESSADAELYVESISANAEIYVDADGSVGDYATITLRRDRTNKGIWRCGPDGTDDEGIVFQASAGRMNITIPSDSSVVVSNSNTTLGDSMLYVDGGIHGAGDIKIDGSIEIGTRSTVLIDMEVHGDSLFFYVGSDSFYAIKP